jgi:hypothetical protein
MNPVGETTTKLTVSTNETPASSSSYPPSLSQTDLDMIIQAINKGTDLKQITEMVEPHFNVSLLFHGNKNYFITSQIIIVFYLLVPYRTRQFGNIDATNPS